MIGPGLSREAGGAAGTGATAGVFVFCVLCQKHDRTGLSGLNSHSGSNLVSLACGTVLQCFFLTQH